MKYDFTSIIDRHGKDSVAVENVGKKIWGNEPEAPKEGFDSIPMWVADMNFATAPSITKALQERISHPLYGYFMEPDKYFDSIINWQETHHKVTGLKREHIGYENGVHGCVSTVVERMTNPGDRILVHAPYYMGFAGDIEYIGRTSVFSELKKDENGIYRMDYEDMDKKIKENNIHLAIMCSPHNPAGRVWERWELEKAMEVYQKNDCFVISDEIWADITFEGHQHIPTQMVSDWARENTVAVYAPSKTFNLAGLIGSYHIIYNSFLKNRMGMNHYNSQNVLSMHALMGAYSDEGAEWAAELNTVLEENCRYTCEYIQKNCDGVEVTMPEGTYMIFLDCTEFCKKSGKTLDEVIKAGWEVGVGWQDGRRFMGPCHIRMNLASPYSRIKKACDRLGKYVFVN